MAALIRWSKTAYRTAQLRPAREAYEQRFYAGADAAGVTDPAQREQMARAALRAEMIRLWQLRAPLGAELAAQLAAANAARVAAAAAQVIPKVTAALARAGRAGRRVPARAGRGGPGRIDHPDESWAQLGARAGVSRDVITGRACTGCSPWPPGPGVSPPSGSSPRTSCPADHQSRTPAPAAKVQGQSRGGAAPLPTRTAPPTSTTAAANVGPHKPPTHEASRHERSCS